MRKGKSILGKDVLSLAGGQKLHTVSDLLISEEGAEILALVVDTGGLLGTPRVVPIDAVHSFGKDAVVVTDGNSVVAADQLPSVRAALNRSETLIGKKVFTDSGEQHGTITDMYFDERNGRILAYAVTGGVFNSVTRNDSYLAISQIDRIGPDLVYIRPEAVEQLQAAAAATSPGGAASGDGQTEAQQAEAASGSGHPLVGRRPSRDVEDDTGRTIVAGGQRVTAEHVEEARGAGKLDDLMAAVGVGQPQGTDASGAISQVGDSAGSLWDQFTRKLGEVTDASGRRVDEAQTKRRLQEIEDAVGRPVTKVILDRSDSVLLNVGDIITHEAVQKAHEAGALDSLLASVYKAQVTFDREELKASQPGTATVENATGEAPLLDELQQKVDQAEQERAQAAEQKKRESEQTRQQRDAERQKKAQERSQQQEQQEAQVEEERKAAEAPATPPTVSTS